MSDVDLMQLIHGCDVYDGFDLSPLHTETDLQGWGGHREFFDKMLKAVRPKNICEVGTWKGKSACTMASIMDELSEEYHDKVIKGRAQNVPNDSVFDNTQIVCVDTWLGAAEFVGAKEGTKRYLSPVYGFPQVYYQFLSNVVNEDLAHRIVPFPQTSTNAARFFEKAGVRFDLVYIDASHEYVDVKADLWAWAPNFEQGGVMFGDDYCEYWDGVRQAVDEFQDDMQLELQTFRYENPDGQAPSDYWVLSKNGVKL